MIVYLITKLLFILTFIYLGNSSCMYNFRGAECLKYVFPYLLISKVSLSVLIALTFRVPIYALEVANKSIPILPTSRLVIFCPSRPLLPVSRIRFCILGFSDRPKLPSSLGKTRLSLKIFIRAKNLGRSICRADKVSLLSC